MTDITLPKATAALGAKRHALAPEIDDAFLALSRKVFAEGALDRRSKQLIAVAVAHVTQCPWCIEGHTRGAKRAGASNEQIMEAIWVAVEMRAGAAYAHANKTLALLEQIDGDQG